ncbi:hypothetical protein FNV43_RR02558 [Rhamnella rubrinervis]|uniref:Ankyrin repeat protein n=1 Tax=Rhamnella rubrinervis TaxID=2594499 RepID=A0A8K0MTU8_9ROSA|nr:hypothetical protein FNV43_RR02558 [Rhamnella rubrinervis]
MLGADVNLKNNGGHTALHYAASKGQLKIAEALIAHGAKLNLKDKVALLLIRRGANVDVEDKEGYTVLGRAADDFRPILFTRLFAHAYSHQQSLPRGGINVVFLLSSQFNCFQKDPKKRKKRKRVEASTLTLIPIAGFGFDSFISLI